MQKQNVSLAYVLMHATNSFSHYYCYLQQNIYAREGKKKDNQAISAIAAKATTLQPNDMHQIEAKFKF